MSSIVKQYINENNGGKIIPICISLIFTAIGCFFFFPLVNNLISARNWEKIPCIIISGQIIIHQDSEGDTYSVEIVYKYRYGNTEYTSRRYDFNRSSSSDYESKEAIVRGYPPDTKTFCYVNPQKPDQSVINRDFNFSMLIDMILPLVFIFIGFTPVFFVFKKQKINVIPSVPQGSEVVLKNKDAPFTRLIIIIILALICNGIIIIPLWDTVSGKTDIWTNFYIIPLAVAGMALIIASIYYFICMFNPRSEIILSSIPVTMGKEVTLRWKLSGNTYVLKDFHILLEGREEATYRKGTASVTDKEIFSVINIFDTENPEYMKEGSAKFTIPSDSMHTFNAPNNKILWHICINGKINYWPDIKEEYEITVIHENLIKKGVL